MSKDLRETIKGERKSHLSLETNKNAEFHLRLDELSLKPEQKGRYYVCYPVECVSDQEAGKASNGEDIEMARFVQMGTPDIRENTESKLKRVARKISKGSA